MSAVAESATGAAIHRPPTVDVEAVIDALSSIREGDGREDRFPALDLPGFGRPRENCGDDIIFACSHCGKPHPKGRNCAQSTCPMHAATWVRRRATKHCRKIAAARAVMDDERSGHVKNHHLVASPPPGQTYDGDPLEVPIEAIRKIMREFGIEGVVYPHPYRGKKELDEVEDTRDELETDGDREPVDGFEPIETPDLDREDYLEPAAPPFQDELTFNHREYRSDARRAASQSRGAGDDRGAWKHRLNSQRPWTDQQGRHRDDLSGAPVREELTLSPHFHIVGAAEHVDGGDVTKRIYEETGWIIHRITAENSGVSIYGNEQLARTVTYCLSHTGLYETENGTMRTAARIKGELINTVDTPEKYAEQWERTCRKAAAVTLGIPYTDMFCVEEDVTPVEHGAGSYHTLAPDAGDGATASGDTAETTAADGGTSTPIDHEAGGGACDGSLVDLASTAALLEDPEWYASAKYADELLATYRAWSDELEWLPDVPTGEHLPDEPPTDVAIDHPPPD